MLHAFGRASDSPVGIGAKCVAALAAVTAVVAGPSALFASEASIRMPDLSSVKFLNNSINGHTLLALGLIVCVIGLIFGLIIYKSLQNMPVHKSMLEVSELIYETCKTYLFTQGKYLAFLWVFIGAVMFVYFKFLAHDENGNAGLSITKVLAILAFSLLGIAGSYGVAWFGIRINTFANSRTAFAALKGKPYPCYAIPLKAGMSIGTVLISVELLIMLLIICFVPADFAGPCFIGFAIGESLGAAALRIAGGIFTKIADIGSDLMKIVFKIKEDDARNPGVIADCTGDNAGDSVGPTADGFETYGVTGVALITFILLAVTPTTLIKHDPSLPLADATALAATLQVQLLVWIFAMRVVMILASVGSYLLNEAVAKAKYQNADKMDFEAPLTSLVWLTSIVSIILTFIVSYLLVPSIASDTTLWWKLSTIISFGTIAGAIIPEAVKVFTSTHSTHVKEVVASSREGGASLNILSGLTAGNFSAYWMGILFIVLMGGAYFVSNMGVGNIMIAPAIFAFGLVAFGFLGMGPVTIAVDSYGPVTDNAQSVYELSTIEAIPNIKSEVKKDFNFDLDFEKAKHFLEENDGAGNTFKATAKPVLIGTAVVGATTMIFAIIMMLTDGLKTGIENLSILHPPFLLGMMAGGAVIYWFTGASTQAVITGAYRAVEFIKANIKLDDSVTKASIEDSKKVVEICTIYAQKGMTNIFFAVLFSTLAFAMVEPFFFIGYLIAIALFGLYQAIFMANAGGAWDNAKKVVEVELKMKGTPLHDASVVGDTVGDPFKDTSSVAMNPIIKFTTLFGLLAVELAVAINQNAAKANAESGSALDKAVATVAHGSTVLPTTSTLSAVLAAVFFLISTFFVWRSFYGMRIKA